MKKFDDLFIKLGSDKICVSLCREQILYDMKNEWKSITHNHQTFELHYICNGSVELNMQSKDGNFYAVSLSKGDIAIIEPNIYHSTKKNEKAGNKLSFNFDISQKSICKNYFQSEKGFTVLSNLELENEFLKLIDSTVNENYSYFDSERKALLMYIFSKITVKLQEMAKIKSRNGKEYSDKMQRQSIIDDFFNLDRKNEKTVGELAKLLHLSDKQTTRVLQKETGKTFRQLLIEKRMEYAKMLLQESDLSVEKISEKVGYSTASSFIRSFEEYSQLTPFKYREKTKNNEVLHF